MRVSKPPVVSETAVAYGMCVCSTQRADRARLVHAAVDHERRRLPLALALDDVAVEVDGEDVGRAQLGPVRAVAVQQEAVVATGHGEREVVVDALVVAVHRGRAEGGSEVDLRLGDDVDIGRDGSHVPILAARGRRATGRGRTACTSSVRRARRPVRSSCRSAEPRMPTIMRLAMNRSGSGSHLRPRWPTHGSLVRSLRALEDQVGERAARDVRGHDAVAGVAAGPREAGRAVVHHRHAPVARHAQRPAPVVRDRGPRRPGRSGAGSTRSAARAPRRGARSPRGSASPACTARRGRRWRCGRPWCAARRRTGGAGRRSSRAPTSRAPPTRPGLSGSVATISEYSGRNRRPSPGSSVVYASVARTTVPAVTVPCVVTTRRGPISTAGVRS